MVSCVVSARSWIELAAHVAGRLAGASAMGTKAVRDAASLRQLSAIWDAYLRDAGAGDVGREHQVMTTGLFTTVDPRRDGVLLWLIDHAAPAMAECAAVAARAVGAKQRFAPERLEALALALELMPTAPDRLSAAATFEWVWTYVGHLRAEPDFSETTGETIQIALPAARLSTYRPASPGACWAANLALAAQAPATLLTIPAGTLSRLLFRFDVESEEQERVLAADWLHALEQSDAALWEVHRDLNRGANDLARLSKNARGRDAWALIAGTGGLTRAQLRRALGLSRGGAGLVVQQLLNAGLVCSGDHGLLVRAGPQERAIAPLDDSMADAAVAVDRAMADLDRLLARMGN
jgi:hypothetical protein